MSGFPSHWLGPLSLGQVSVVSSGYWGDSDSNEKRNVSVSVVRNGDISRSGALTGAASRFFSEREASRSHTQSGDVLFTSSGDIGKTYLCESEDLHVSNFVKCLRPNADMLESRYLYYLCQSPAVRDLIPRHSGGTTLVNLHKSFFEEPWIWLPPIDEQRRTVAILEDHLSRLDAALGMTKSAAERLRVFERSLLQNAILGRTGPAADKPVDPGTGLPCDWKWESWPEVGESQNGKAFSSRLYQPHGVRLIRPGNLSSDGSMSWTDTNTRCLPPEVAEENPSYMVREGEIVMNLTAQSLKDDFLGRVCMTGAGEAALLNQRLARLKPQRVESRFAYYVFRSPIFRHFVSSLNTGSLIQHMFTKQLADFRLPIPPMEEQVAIADFLDAEQVRLRHSEGLLSPLERRANGLRRSLLAAAFSGQMTKEIVNV